MAVRKLLDFVFTQSDLYWLDHLLPDELRRAKEDNGENEADLTHNERVYSSCSIVFRRRNSRLFAS